MVRSWEAGNRPRDYYELFILIYATDDELASRAATPGSELDRLMAAFDAMGIAMDRRKFLLNSAALTVGVAANASLLDLFDDDPMQAALGRLRYLESLSYSGESAGRVYRLLVRHAGDLGRLASRFKDSDAGTGLRAVQARTFSKAGHLAFYDLGRHTAAQEHLRAGMEAARQSGEPRLRAKLCVNLAHRLVYDPAGDARTNLHDALWLTDSGLRYAEGNPFALTEIYDMQAFIYASLGNEHSMKEALDRAAATIEHAKASNKPEWLSGVSIMHVQETAGCSYIRLGKARLAADEISRALRPDSSEADRLHRSLVLAWGAQASAKLKEPEHAVSLLGEAIPTVSKSKSVVRAKEIRTARAELQPWDREPFIRQLDDQLALAGLTAEAPEALILPTLT